MPAAFDAISTAVSRESSDSLLFGTFLALALHAIVILGITFELEGGAVVTPTLEITLATQNDQSAPQEADFIASSNQLGSGSLDEARDMTTDVEAQRADSQINEQWQAPVPRQQLETDPSSLIASSASAERSANAEADSAQRQVSGSEVAQTAQLDSELASLRARLAEQRQSFSKRPRVRTITAAAAKSSEDAAYLLSWREHIERVGNQNYPDEARRRNLSGELRLLLALNPDGSIHTTRILQSSGTSLLDAAALRIVHLAAPYRPFPQAMRQDVDRLEIIRTWRFTQTDQLEAR